MEVHVAYFFARDCVSIPFIKEEFGEKRIRRSHDFFELDLNEASDN